MTDTADLEKRLRQLAASTDAKTIFCVRWNEPTGLPDWTPFGATESLSDKLTEAADALSSLTRKLEEAHKIASDRAFERDAEADRLYARGLQYDGSICKMQGATAAVIANDILAIMRGSNLSTAQAPESSEGQ